MDNGSAGILPIFDLISRHARERPSAPAILSADSGPLTYAALHRVVVSTAATLRQRGVRREDRVAVVLPGGPELCVALVSVAAGAVCVPLNPQLADTDWGTRMREVDVRALVTRTRTNPMAEQAARDLGIPIITPSRLPEAGAGAFSWDGATRRPPAAERFAGLDDDAFILHTSGTTSRPKAVPLTHSNVVHAAAETVRSLGLTPDDRLLGVLPLYHAHGLISGLISTLVAGASIVPMHRFSADSFFEHLHEFQPSWYTAVPAIHQAVVAEARRAEITLNDHSLRLIRSASAPLTDWQHGELERLFGVPVIEAYGMTETASQITSNPLPPGKPKPGSAGLPTGISLAILDNEGRALDAGKTGEIALRGPNVTRCPEGLAAEKTAIREGEWFLTGDMGFRDDHGYLFITGRAKDLINRGGEKIAPKRVEGVLLLNPAIAEAVVFPVPSSRLGEDVGAAVVLREGARLTARDIRKITLESGRLSLSELPRRIVIVSEIPRNPSGKVQRHLMADRLNLTGRPERPSSRGRIEGTRPCSVERTVAEIWKDVLSIGDVGVEDDFFALGGDSLLAVQVAIRVSETLGVMLSLRDLFEAPTVVELSRLIADRRQSGRDEFLLQKSNPEASIQAPVSFGQEQILNVEANLRGYPIYMVPFAYRLDGAFDHDAFERSVKALIAKHETLRVVFKRIGAHWRSIPSGAVNIKVPVEDWRIVPDAHRAAFIESLLDDEVWAVFDLTRAAPFRLRLIRFSEQHHVLIIVIHHIIMDAWTMKNLLEDLFRCYAVFRRGERLSTIRPEFQFSDYARWQRTWCGGGEAARQLDYWRHALHGAGPTFGTDGPPEQTGASFATERVPVRLSRRLVEGLTELARRESTTLLVLLLTGLKAHLGSTLGKWDSCVAVPMANRSRPNTREMLGLIENTVVVRAAFSPEMPFLLAAARLRDALLDAHARQELPYELMVKRLVDENVISRGVSSEIYFSLLDHYEPSLKVRDLEVSRMELSLDKNSILPLNDGKMMFLLKQTVDGIVGSLIFKTAHLSASDVQKFMSGYTRALSAALDEPERPLAKLSS